MYDKKDPDYFLEELYKELERIQADIRSLKEQLESDPDATQTLQEQFAELGAQLSELRADLAESAPASELISPPLSTVEKQQPPVKDALHDLIQSFSLSNLDNFHKNCQKLIDTYGFSSVKDAFFTVLATKDVIKKSKGDENLANSLRAINQYLMNGLMNTISAVSLEGARIQAEGFTKILEIPDEDFLVEARAMAEKDSYKALKQAMKQRAEHTASEEIMKVNQSPKTPEAKEKAIARIKNDLEEKIKSIDEMKQLPLDYYVNKARLLKLKQDCNLFLPASGQCTGLITNFITNDILSKKSLAERTLVMEQYILIAKKLLDSGHANAAFIISSALEDTAIFRLAATKKGLSPAAQTQLDVMSALFSSELNSANFMRYAQAHPMVYMLPNMLAGFIEFSTTDMIKVKEDGTLETPIMKTPTFEYLQGARQKVGDYVLPAEAVEKLVGEMSKEKYDFSDPKHELFETWRKERMQKMKASLNETIQISRALEPANNTLKPSTIVHDVEPLMIPVFIERHNKRPLERVRNTLSSLFSHSSSAPADTSATCRDMKAALTEAKNKGGGEEKEDTAKLHI